MLLTSSSHSSPPPRPPRRSRSRASRGRRSTLLIVSATLIGLGVLFFATNVIAAEVRTTTLVSSGPFGGNPNVEAELGAVTSDGKRMFIETEAQLLSEDSNLSYDIYERVGDTIRLVTTGTDPGNAYVNAISADGSRVFFETTGSLVAEDTDTRTDIYESAEGAFRLLSIGPAGGNGEHNVQFTAVSDDGERAFFRTEESLLPTDTDASHDVYRRTGEGLVRITVGPNGSNGPFDGHVLRVSADGSRAIVWTDEQLLAADTDTSYDLYERSEEKPSGSRRGPSGATGPSAPASSTPRVTPRSSCSGPKSPSSRRTPTASPTATSGTAKRRFSPRSAPTAETGPSSPKGGTCPRPEIGPS